MGVPVVVVTHEIPTDWVEAHPEAPFHFVTDGVEAAVAKAQEIAGERTVAVTAGTIARQCLELGLLDAVAVDLVPVVMGQGRPFFGELSTRRCPSGRPDRASRVIALPTSSSLWRSRRRSTRMKDEDAARRPAGRGPQSFARLLRDLGYDVSARCPRRISAR